MNNMSEEWHELWIVVTYDNKNEIPMCIGIDFLVID